MSTVKTAKITIKGDYWDSFVYRDRLFLLDTKKNIRIYRWSELVMRNSNIDNFLGLKCAFLNSDYLYNVREIDLFLDPDLKKLIINKINAIEEMVFDENELKSDYVCKVEQVPIDIGFYNNILYYIDSRGFFSRNINFKNKHIISRNERKIADIKAQCISIGSGGRILLSSSDDGIYEYDYRPFNIDGYELIRGLNFDGESIYKISNEHSTSCEWAFNTIVNTSYYSVPHIFPFKYEKNEMDDSFELITGEKIRISKLFQDYDEDECVITANNEKIYCIYKNKIEGYDYIQKYIDKDDAMTFTKLETIDVHFDGIIVASQVTEFGIIIETVSSLYVLQSNGTLKKINRKPNEIVRWRVFQRSNCYENQLHIVYEDRIEILSFNSDCFSEQRQKIIGNKHLKQYKNKKD